MMAKDEGLNWVLMSRSELETQQLGERLSPFLIPGCVVELNGELGVGKSVFARGVVWGMGVEDPYITSPTFTLMNTYTEGRIPVYHFDFYRLSSPDELGLTGTDEYLDGAGVALVEWAERGGDWIPADRLVVELLHQEENPDLRHIELRAEGPRSREILHGFRQRYPD
ncbi:MAG: tRNA (adenosine(37)-N6)-threonylcarbamoyltransferase complex ATPase subunit type 1 TsaE [Magnetococcales bacterium]|nr:tRNA (adenosine(37)-N6)-threonylcarbamoyltransferase complex ATPase subunit type 1 TsaE [Magnetococcales bacterium]